MKNIISTLLLLLTIFSIGCEKKSGKIELNFLETLSSPARTELLKTLIADYEAKNPNIEINLISPPYEQAEGKLSQMLNAKQPLDIIESRDATIKQFVNNGNVISLDDYIDNWEYKDSLLPLAIDSARIVDNTAYLLPYLFFAKGMFVRTDILEENNIPVPTTIDEFVEASIKLTSDNENRFGFAMRGKHNAFKVSEDYLIVSDLDNIDTESFYWTEDGEFTLSTEAARKGLERYKRLYKEGTPVDAINWGFAEQINGFASGVTSFLIQDPDAISMLEQQIDSDQYNVYPLPVGKTGKAYQDSAFQGLSIVSYSKYPEEAWKFISYLVAPEQNAKFCKLYGAIPVHKDVFDNDPYFNSPKFNAWKTMFSESDTWVFSKYPFDSEKFAAWAPFREQTMQKYLLGEADIDTTIAEWENYWK